MSCLLYILLSYLLVAIYGINDFCCWFNLQNIFLCIMLKDTLILGLFKIVKFESDSNKELKEKTWPESGSSVNGLNESKGWGAWQN